MIEKVTHSDWAAPFVVIHKSDGTLRIYGNYKVTINQFLDVDAYSLPKPEDLMVSLTEGKKFTMIVISHQHTSICLLQTSPSSSSPSIHIGDCIDTRDCPLVWPPHRPYFRRLWTRSFKVYSVLFVTLTTSWLPGHWTRNT